MSSYFSYRWCDDITDGGLGSRKVKRTVRFPSFWCHTSKSGRLRTHWWHQIFHIQYCCWHDNVWSTTGATSPGAPRRNSLSLSSRACQPRQVAPGGGLSSLRWEGLIWRQGNRARLWFDGGRLTERVPILSAFCLPVTKTVLLIYLNPTLQNLKGITTGTLPEFDVWKIQTRCEM